MLVSQFKCATAYPPYTSKYNPIEHRLFPHVTRACQGVIFTSLELVKKLTAKTHTKTGLFVVVNVSDKIYETGRKVAKGFKETMKIIFDEYLPKWNPRCSSDYLADAKVIKFSFLKYCHSYLTTQRFRYRSRTGNTERLWVRKNRQQ
ncbi:hypothetical protein QUA82_10920 [Microcoleus sp. F8-D3]